MCCATADHGCGAWSRSGCVPSARQQDGCWSPARRAVGSAYAAIAPFQRDAGRLRGARLGASPQHPRQGRSPLEPRSDAVAPCRSGAHAYGQPQRRRRNGRATRRPALRLGRCGGRAAAARWAGHHRRVQPDVVHGGVDGVAVGRADAHFAGLARDRFGAATQRGSIPQRSSSSVAVRLRGARLGASPQHPRQGLRPLEPRSDAGAPCRSGAHAYGQPQRWRRNGRATRRPALRLGRRGGRAAAAGCRPRWRGWHCCWSRRCAFRWPGW
jgi:hypothetical protein